MVPIFQVIKEIDVGKEQQRQRYQVPPLIKAGGQEQEFAGQKAEKQPQKEGKDDFHDSISTPLPREFQGERQAVIMVAQAFQKIFTTKAPRAPRIHQGKILRYFLGEFLVSLVSWW
jgi:hypothetical protein